VQTRRLAASFNNLTRSVTLTGPEKFYLKATCFFFIFKNPQGQTPFSVNPNFYFLLITFESGTLESQSRAEKTRIIA